MADTLHLLEADAARLLLDGAAASQGDPGLLARGAALATIAAAAPALSRLADQASRAIAGGGADLLELAGMAAQVGSARARVAAGTGALQGLPPARFLPVFLPQHEIELLYYTLHQRRGGLKDGQIRGAALQTMVTDAAESGAARDARLRELWQDNLLDAQLGEVVRKTVVPVLGRAAAGLIEASLSLPGGQKDAALLRCLFAIHSQDDWELLLKAYRKGSPVVREVALEGLGEIAPATALELAISRLLAAKGKDAGGLAAVRIATQACTDEALEALLAALLAGNPHASGALSSYQHPRTTERLLDLLTPDRLASEQAAWIVRALGARQDPVALPRLLALWRAQSPHRLALGESLLQFDSPEALAALADDLTVPGATTRDLAIAAADRLGPAAAYERLSPWLAPERIQQPDGLAMAARIMQVLGDAQDRQWDPRWMRTWQELTSRALVPAGQFLSGAWKLAGTTLLQQGGGELYDGTAWLFEASALARPEALTAVSTLLFKLNQSGRPLDERWQERLLGLLEDPNPPYLPWARENFENALQVVAASPGTVSAETVRRAMRAIQPATRARRPTVVLFAARYAGLEAPAQPHLPAPFQEVLDALASRDRVLAQAIAAEFLAAPEQAVRYACATAMAAFASPGDMVSRLVAPDASPATWANVCSVLLEMKGEIVSSLFDPLPPDAALELGRRDEQPGWLDRGRTRVAEVIRLLLARPAEAAREPRAQDFLAQVWNRHPVPDVRHMAGVALLISEAPDGPAAIVAAHDYAGHNFAIRGYRQLVILALRAIGSRDPAKAFDLAAPLFHPDRLARTGGKALAAETVQSFLPEPPSNPHPGPQPATWTVVTPTSNYQIPCYPEMISDPRWLDRAAAL